MTESSAFISLILRLFYASLGILNVFLLNKLFGIEFYGHYAWIISATFFGSLIVLSGINQYLIKYYSEHDALPNSLKGIFIHLFLLFITTSIFLLTFGVMIENSIIFFAPFFLLIVIFTWLNADLNKLFGKIISFEFNRFGLMPISLFIAVIFSFFLNLNVSIFISLYLICALTLLALRRSFNIKISSKKTSIREIRKKSFPFLLISLGTSIFSIFDIVLAAAIFTPKEVAIYSIMTRAAIIFMMPLNFFSAKYHVPIIKAFKNNNELSLRSEIRSKKIISSLLIIIATIAIYWANQNFYENIEKILEGLGDSLNLIPVAAAMIVIRLLCFDYVIKLQYCLSPTFFANFTIGNIVLMLLMILLIGSNLSLFQYSLLIASFSIFPSLISMAMCKIALKN